jgi:hypothetical protein
VLHPYGKGLILDPHVHVLFTEGGLTKGGGLGFCFFFGVCVLWRVW